MSTLSVQMNALRDALAAMYPTRMVTRDLLDFAQRDDTELLAGIYTVVARNEGDYSHTMGREAYYGTLKIGVLGQIRVAENLTPSAVEDAEGLMIDEIKALVRSRTVAINSLQLVALRQSGQLEHPYGWVAFEMTMVGE